VKGAVNLAGVGDIDAFIPAQLVGCRDATVVEALLGGSPATVPERYAQASAGKMLPLGVPQALIWGQHDSMTPTHFGHDYASSARKAGDEVTLTIVPSPGHFEIADPASTAWPIVHETVRALLGMRRWCVVVGWERAHQPTAASGRHPKRRAAPDRTHEFAAV
jgi:pimeloyl-ACP methyl ester carboxylesterase